MKRYSVYISGGMRNYPLWNFPAFDEARDMFAAAGIQVFSPADHDREMGFDPTTGVTSADYLNLDPWETFAKWDLERVAEADIIYCLPGWENSVGANVEVDLAIWLNGMTGGKTRMIFEGTGDPASDVVKIIMLLKSPPRREPAPPIPMGGTPRKALTSA